MIANKRKNGPKRAWKRFTLAGALALLVAGSVHGGHAQRFLVTGFGNYLITTSSGEEIDAKFALFGLQGFNRARGRFRHSLEFQGLPVEFHGKITCLAVDPDNSRVWVGGIITRNLSVHPSFTGEINEPGKDIWFRVLDTGRNAAEPDRSTFVGFEGSAGIITSEEYCAAQPWPDNNERTNPVTKGGIKVKIRY